MPSAAYEHASNIAAESFDLLFAKYFAGQEAHGGVLPEKRMAWNLVEEALDQVVYSLTLRAQHDALAQLARTGTEAELRAAVLKFCDEDADA